MMHPDYRTWYSVFERVPESRRNHVVTTTIYPSLAVYCTGNDLTAFLANNAQWVEELQTPNSGFENILTEIHTEPNGATLKLVEYVKLRAATIITVYCQSLMQDFVRRYEEQTTTDQHSEELNEDDFKEIFQAFKQSLEEFRYDSHWLAIASQIRDLALKAGCPTAMEDPLDSIDMLRHHVLGNREAAPVSLNRLSNVGSHIRPSRRGDFLVAILCALPREFDAVSLLFDEFWDDDGYNYGRASGDTNTYTTGRIGVHHVVLVVLPAIGTTDAAAAAVNLRSSFSNIKLVLIVGVCGGVPKIAGRDAFLGDVVVSNTIVQYDYGRQYPECFIVRNTIEDSLGRANKDIRSFLTSLKTNLGREYLQRKAAVYLKQLQDAAKCKGWRIDYQFPGIDKDKLFQPNYRHLHHTSCHVCGSESGGVCEVATTASCRDLSCDEANLVPRERMATQGDYRPEIFIGRLGSGNTVMKSAEDRDRIATEHDIMAFEMEGAGAWDEVPCIVVKGICDYSDSHKHKGWQDFAAATAASVARAMLERYVRDDASASS